MSLHSAQTSSGITPRRINRANALQPRHRANTDSSVAATARAPSTIQAASGASKTSASAAAVTENTAPIACAKRLGGPGTGFASSGNRGTMTRVTSWPSGLNVGPAATRAAKP